MIKNSLLITIVLILLGCSSTPVQTLQYGGSGTETVGITGTIVDSNLVGVSHATLVLHKSNFLDTLSASLYKTSPYFDGSVYTDDSGKFIFSSVDTGEYIIEATDGNHHAVVMTCTLKRLDTLVVLKKQVLLSTGTITGTIPQIQDMDPIQASVSIYGLKNRGQITSKDGKFTISDVPHGNYRYKIIPHTPLYSSIDTTNVKVDAGKYSELGIIKMPQRNLAINPSDSVIVRAILDSNGLFAMRIDQVSSVSAWPFRVTGFRVIDPAITKLTSRIGELSALRSIDVRSNRGDVRGIGIKRIPKEISKLSHLKSLNLSNNQIDTLPHDIGELDSLEFLNVSGNLLTSMPREIGRLHRLKNLNICNNQLDSLPHEIGTMDSLDSLNIANNLLATLPPEIGHLKSVITIVADHNQLASVPVEIANCNSLQYLYLGNNQFSAIPQIGPLDRYNYIGLENNNISRIPFDIIPSHSHQNFINIDGNMMCSDTAVVPLVENWLNDNSYNHQEWKNSQCRPDHPVDPQSLPKGRDPNRPNP